MGSPDRNYTWVTCNNEKLFERENFAFDIYKDRYILVAGGYRRRRERLSSAVIYDIHNYTYVSLPNIPFSGLCKGAVRKDHFYVFSSYGKSYYMNLISCSTWNVVETRLQGLLDTVVSHKNNLYLLNYIHRSKITCFDPTQNRLISLPDMPKKCSCFASSVVKNKIFVIGGYFYPNPLSSVQVFDICTQSWSEGHALPKPLINAAATTILDRWIVVTGGNFGCKGQEYSTKTFIFDTLSRNGGSAMADAVDIDINIPSIQPKTKGWAEIDMPLSPPRRNHRCVTIRSQIISVGGNDPTGNYCPMYAIHIKRLIPDWRWEMIKGFVYLRKLVDTGRAYRSLASKRINESIMWREDDILEYLMTYISLDLFRYVMSFFI